MAIAVAFASCEDNGNDGGIPEIQYVRITDPAKADSTFTQAYAGQMIVIVGKNLQNAQKVFINDQEIAVNANYNTATNIILTIPTEEDGFVLTYLDPTLKSEIRVETDHGTALYNFLVCYPNPAITAIDAENYPTPTGDIIEVSGNNFVDIQKVYFTNIDPANPDEASETETQIVISNYDIDNHRYLNATGSYVTESLLTFALPDLPRVADNYFGYLVIECKAGITYLRFSTLPKPSITNISSDMPVPGEKVTINGMYFIDIEYIDINDGEIRILSEDISYTRTSITFNMPAKPSSAGNLKVVAYSGEGIVENFYPYNNLLLDFDTKGYNLNWDPSATYQEADGVTPPFVSDGNYALIKATDNGWNWWGTMIYWSANVNEAGDGAGDESFILPSYDLIPENTPAEKVYLAYECYNTNAFNGSCFIHYQLQTAGGADLAYENFDWGTNLPADAVLPGYDGQQLLNTWYMVMIPMSKFGAFTGKTYKDIVDAQIKTIRLMEENWGGTPQELNLCIDNIRMISR
jgi:hypothetical protein